MKLELKDVNMRVIDQRIGAGIGGFDTVIRLIHEPTGIVIEMPRLTRSQSGDRQAALDALEMALTQVPARTARQEKGERG